MAGNCIVSYTPITWVHPPYLILGKKRRKEEKLTGQAKENHPLPLPLLVQGLDLPLNMSVFITNYMYYISNTYILIQIDIKYFNNGT